MSATAPTREATASERPVQARGFEAFYEVFFPVLSGWLRRRLDDEEDAQALALEILARVIQSPVFRLSKRARLPLDTLVEQVAQELLADYRAGWRPIVV